VKYISITSLFVSSVILFVAMVIPQSMVSQSSLSPTAVNGKHIFNQSCSACHDTLGATIKSGPELKSYYRRQPRPNDAAVHAIIQQGKGKMPAFSTLNKSQIDDLVAYLRTL
jgi:mono/diheme cytochrome c family protein